MTNKTYELPISETFSRHVPLSCKWHHRRRVHAWCQSLTLDHPICSAPTEQLLDSFQTIKFPLTTESAMKKIEDNNTLVSLQKELAFVCVPRAMMPSADHIQHYKNIEICNFGGMDYWLYLLISKFQSSYQRQQPLQLFVPLNASNCTAREDHVRDDQG